MKIRLHRPKRGLWNLALLLFVLGLVGSYVAVPILSGYAFYLVVISAALLLLGAGICLAVGRSRLALGGAALVMALALALTGFLNVAQTAPPIPTGPIVYVDISHQERFDRLLWEETSIGGLNYNLVRNGGVPLLLREIEGETLAGAELLVLIAPGQPFSTQEVETISDWVSEGGRLLVSVGFEESGASEDLLA